MVPTDFWVQARGLMGLGTHLYPGYQGTQTQLAKESIEHSLLGRQLATEILWWSLQKFGGTAWIPITWDHGSSLSCDYGNPVTTWWGLGCGWVSGQLLGLASATQCSLRHVTTEGSVLTQGATQILCFSGWGAKALQASLGSWFTLAEKGSYETHKIESFYRNVLNVLNSLRIIIHEIVMN